MTHSNDFSMKFYRDKDNNIIDKSMTHSFNEDIFNFRIFQIIYLSTIQNVGQGVQIQYSSIEIIGEKFWLISHFCTTTTTICGFWIQ